MATIHPVAPSSIAVQLSNTSDEEICKKGMRDIVHMLRHLERDYRWLIYKHNGLVGDANLQSLPPLLEEIKALKESNQKLQENNQDMRDLCCFLDDDRQRGKKLTREWQKFGRYSATVMKREVTSYQLKLHDLERKQEVLIKDNKELKQLCLYLDQEVSGLHNDRDEGDGSSNTTTASEQQLDDVTQMQPVMNGDGDSSNNLIQNTDTSLEYERNLDMLQADGDRHQHSSRQQPIDHHAQRDQSPVFQYPQPLSLHNQSPINDELKNSSLKQAAPAAVMSAVKVLGVHNTFMQPDHADDGGNLNMKEKAVVREMCNVVWRKLGDVKNSQDRPREPREVAQLAGAQPSAVIREPVPIVPVRGAPIVPVRGAPIAYHPDRSGIAQSYPGSRHNDHRPPP